MHEVHEPSKVRTTSESDVSMRIRHSVVMTIEGHTGPASVTVDAEAPGAECSEDIRFIADFDAGVTRLWKV